MMPHAQDFEDARACIERIKREDPNFSATLRPGKDFARKVLAYARGEHGQRLDLVAVMDVLEERTQHRRAGT